MGGRRREQLKLRREERWGAVAEGEREEGELRLGERGKRWSRDGGEGGLSLF